MKQHKWHKEIKAWAEGKKIEAKWLSDENEEWQYVETPIWDATHWEYRIKPQPKEMNPEPNEEFTWWYERVFLQSPSMCELKYDDEKMWQAWIAGYKLGRDNAYKRKDIPIETFTILKRENKEPQYLYAFLLEVGTKKGDIVFGLNDSHIDGFSYIGKIKLEE